MPDFDRVFLMLRDRIRAGGRQLLRVATGRKPELLEPRCLLNAAPIEFGAVYVEQDLGSDSSPDTIEISFVGGAPGTQLTRVEINGDKNAQGLSVADIIFDTEPGGLGADLFFAGRISGGSGEFTERLLVEDGASKLVLLLDGFDAGEKLTLSIDVDEVQGFDPSESALSVINEGLDPITSGVEFQGSLLTAFFSTPHYHDVSGQAEFRNRYDAQLDATRVDLPRDNEDMNRDRTAGAIGTVTLQPLPIEISGRVFEDRDSDLQQDTDEPGIGNVELSLFVSQDGEYRFTGHSTLTNALGDYSFDVSRGLLPGTYQVSETQPAGYFSVGATVGFVNARQVGTSDPNNPNVLSEIDIPLGGLKATQYNFAEVLPASLSGRVHLSTADGDCLGDRIEHQPVAGATVVLRSSQGDVVAETTTDADGRYAFRNLRPGDYSVTEVTPSDLIDGGAHAGTVDGRSEGMAENDQITQITLLSGEAGIDYEFCEHLPASLSGSVYHDRNDDGSRTANEEGIAGAILSLLDETGSVVNSVTTDQDGRYEFKRVRAGNYRVIEMQPDGWLDGRDRAGRINGRIVGEALNPGDEIRQVALRWGEAGVDYDFGELKPTSLSGRVHVSTPDGDCFGLDERLLEPLAGAIVQLLDVTGQILSETVSEEDGTYSFHDLRPGEYGVRELTPAGLWDGGAHAGQVNGEHRGRVSLTGDIVEIHLSSDEFGTNYDFCEHLPVTLSGYVYSDADNDAIRDRGEAAIPGVTIQLLDQHDTLVATAVTDDRGRYSFQGLQRGDYTIREIHPTGWLDGTDSAGTVDGQTRGQAVNPGDEIRRVILRWGDVGQDYNFAELQPATLSGVVHASYLEDCWNDVAARPLADVEIWLLDAAGQIVVATSTDEAGRYAFSNLGPGQYSVLQQQPLDFFSGSQRAGSGGGDASVDNLISNITVVAGARLVDYDFCELPPSTLSGFVFQDGAPIRIPRGDSLPEDISGIRDGKLSPDDVRLANVELELRHGITGEIIFASEALADAHVPGPIRTVTDEDGFYEFRGLPKGNYAVYEFQPDGYLDGIDTPGTTDGIAINPLPPDEKGIFLNTVISMLAKPPRNDAIVRIGLPADTDSQFNNFSEVLVEEIDPPVRIPAIIEPPSPTAPPPSIDLDFPQPKLTPRSMPPLPLTEVRFPADGSSSVRAHTWHLSIINGGQPRQARPGQDASFFPASLWRQQLRAGRWQIDVSSNESGESEKVFFFGVADGIPITGDFNGDGLSEIGIYIDGQWFIDLNANGRWDGNDLWARLGHEGDLPVTGDWDGDGKDDIGVFGQAWPGDPRAIAYEPGLPDLENVAMGTKNIPPRPEDATLGLRVMKRTALGRMRADVIDHVFLYGTAGDIPVAGDWNGDGIDTIGVFRDGNWKLDVDGNGRWTPPDLDLQFGQVGDLPLVGDFNGDGIDDLAIIRNGVLYIDANGNRRLDSNDLIVRTENAVQGLPVVGKWSADATDRIGWYQHIDSQTTVVANRPEETNR